VFLTKIKFYSGIISLPFNNLLPMSRGTTRNTCCPASRGRPVQICAVFGLAIHLSTQETILVPRGSQWFALLACFAFQVAYHIKIASPRRTYQKILILRDTRVNDGECGVLHEPTRSLVPFDILWTSDRNYAYVYTVIFGRPKLFDLRLIERLCRSCIPPTCTGFLNVSDYRLSLLSVCEL
jgi:hypothetical protein